MSQNRISPTAAQDRKEVDVLIAEAFRAHRAGNLPEALAIYRDVLARAPGHDDALALSGIVQCQMGRIEDGIVALERALAANPDHFDARVNLAHAYDSMDRWDDAVAAYRDVIRRKPDFLDAYHQLTAILERQGKTLEAEQAACAALLAAPEKAEIFYGLIQSQVEHRHLEGALETCERFFAAYPRNMRALAFKAFVLNELGDVTASRALLDFDRLVVCTRHRDVPGYDSLAAFNADLAQFALSHPTLAFEPANKSTHGGSQTTDLHAEAAKPLAALRRLIEQAVDGYCAAFADHPPHPFLDSMPPRFMLEIWATVLAPEGHQKPHFHPGGWLSGVYYPALPDAMRAADSGPAGWIEFGRPQEHFGFKAEPLIHTVRPEEGLMVLFPSYFYHRTIPVAETPVDGDTERRFSIAFDAIASP